jgi:hypothetical protein
VTVGTEDLTLLKLLNEVAQPSPNVWGKAAISKSFVVPGRWSHSKASEYML